MKITYLHQYFITPNMTGGGGTRSYEFAKRLVKMGHEVNMITTWTKPDDRKNWIETEESGIKIHWLPLPYSNHMKYKDRIKAFLIFALKSSKKAASIDTDIIYATSTPLTISLPAIYAAFKKKVPMVFEVRDLWPKIPIVLKIIKNPILKIITNTLEYLTYRYAKSIVALSPAMKEGIITKNISHKKIAVIPNSCDLKNFEYNQKLEMNFRQRRPWLSNNPLLVYAGTFGRINNLQYAIRLAEALKKINSNVKILLIGDGVERNYLINEAKLKKVFEINLFFENSIPKSDISEIFSSATMCANFVMDVKETWANSANKFFDTLAAGKPIFLNHGGWMQDLISFNNCGLCMHGKPMNLVAEELENAMNNNDWLKAAGKTSRILAKKYFDRDLLAKQLEEVLIATKDGNLQLIEKIAPGIYR
jgi:glycosyltransferase involved in cell wall biosynthesis